MAQITFEGSLWGQNAPPQKKAVALRWRFSKADYSARWRIHHCWYPNQKTGGHGESVHAASPSSLAERLRDVLWFSSKWRRESRNPKLIRCPICGLRQKGRRFKVERHGNARRTWESASRGRLHEEPTASSPRRHNKDPNAARCRRSKCFSTLTPGTPALDKLVSKRRHPSGDS